MYIDPEGISPETAAAEILKPMDDLLARETDELKKADEMIDDAETLARKVVIPAKRVDGSESDGSES